MKFIKKRKALAPLLAVCLLAACGGTGNNGGSKNPGTSQNQEQDSITVTFDLNYEGATNITQEVEYNDVAEEPATPTRDRYTFTGWYEEKTCEHKFDFELALTEDTTIYAGWKLAIAEVTFDLNYEGSENSVVRVDVGTTVNQPVTPERDGYIFKAWCVDASASSEFDFTTLINEDVTVYASWEADDGENWTLTYMWNYDDAPNNGVANKVKVKKNTKTKSYAAERDGYYLKGWYTEPECVNEYDFNARVSASATLYARWFFKDTFETEYVDYTGKIGYGYSGNVSGVGLICKQKEAMQNASNGYYAGWSYYEGTTYEFVINAEDDVADAVLIGRFSAEAYDMTFTPENYTISVNGVALSYNAINITNVPGMGAGYKEFADFTINKTVPLKKGENSIKFIVSNHDRLGESGTMYATAPLFDCCRVYSDTKLSWNPLTDNVNGNIS